MMKNTENKKVSFSKQPTTTTTEAAVAALTIIK